MHAHVSLHFHPQVINVINERIVLSFNQNDTYKSEYIANRTNKSYNLLGHFYRRPVMFV